MSNTSRFLLFSFVAFGLFLFGCTSQPPASTDVLVSARLSLSGEPTVNESFNVTVTLIAEKDVRDYSTSLVLPQGLEVVEGSTEWNGELKAGEEKSFSVLVKSVDAGVFKLNLGNNQNSALDFKVLPKPVLIKQNTPTPTLEATSQPSMPTATASAVEASASALPQELVDQREWEEINQPSEPYALELNGIRFTPTERVDPRLLEKANSSNETVFAYLILLGLPSQDKKDAIAATGTYMIGYVGFHSFAIKLPLDKIDELTELWFVKWVGFSQPLQKLGPELRVRLNNSVANETLNVSIHLFESDGVKSGDIKEGGVFNPDFHTKPGYFGKILESDGFVLTHYSDGSSWGTYATQISEEQLLKLTEHNFIEGITEELQGNFWV